MIAQVKHQKLAFFLLTTKSFRFFRKLGVHVTPVHYYSPIPDIREIEDQESLWQDNVELPGIDMNPQKQLQLMNEVIAVYQPECNFPAYPTKDKYSYYTSNIYFGYVSAVAMHSFVRHYRPQKIIEIGSGNSTRVLANAARINANEGFPTELIAIDPYPDETLRSGLPNLTKLIDDKVQQVDLTLFTSLKANDILSIDSSHCIRIGGDVNFLYLEILPRLASGVIVHIHDIFFPYNYPKQWLQQRRFWNEQYLLQAFLIYNSAYEVMWGQKYSELRFFEDYKRVFGGRISEAENNGSYSFWLRVI